MKTYLPVKLNNLASDVCCVNLRFSQNLEIRIPHVVFKIDNNSKLLNLEQKDSNFFEVCQSNKELKNWKFSNLHLGNLEFFSNKKRSSLCVFLENNSNFLTIVAPKDKIKISTDYAVEFVLFSDYEDSFVFNVSGIKNLGYKICNNYNYISDLFRNHTNKFQHHIWLKFCSKFVGNVSFNGKDQDYNFLLDVKAGKQNNQYYKKIIRLIRK